MSISPSPHPRPSTQIAWALLACVLLSLILLALPLAELGERLKEYALLRAALDHWKRLLVAAAIVAAAAAAWIFLARTSRLAFAFLAAGTLGVLALCAYAFQLRYPNAALFSLERYRDSAAMLLGTDAALSRVAPVPTLKVPHKTVKRAAFPVIDVHFHLESLPPTIDADRLVRAMDAVGVDKLVNLGGVPGMFEHFAETFYKKYPDRFILFVKPDPDALQKPNGAELDVEWVKKAARMGARGLKESKSFGLGQRDADGKLVAVDDPRLAPVWDLAGKLGMPVLVHTGEPASFWKPVDARNERYLELLENPDWSLVGKAVPSHEELMQQRERLLARHPGTNFIGAHLGMNPDDLEYAAHLLDTYPNYYVDMSSVVQELGREPYSVRRFFIRYQDRILFGTDGGFGLRADADDGEDDHEAADANGWVPEHMYRSYFEFLETDNEYIEYPLANITKQGTWRVYGIDLPKDVLQKIYHDNAERLIPSHAEVIRRLDLL